MRAILRWVKLIICPPTIDNYKEAKEFFKQLKKDKQNEK